MLYTKSWLKGGYSITAKNARMSKDAKTESKAKKIQVLEISAIYFQKKMKDEHAFIIFGICLHHFFLKTKKKIAMTTQVITQFFA